IDEAFSDLNLHLLPHSQKDFITNCSCPDWENPCKHIAGVYYLVASQLDQDPFLLFELRGISRQKLLQELAKTPLGKLLSSSIQEEQIPLKPVTSYHTKPETIPAVETIDLKEFWHSHPRLPENPQLVKAAIIPAIVIKKAGDYPAFWDKDTSFIEVMEEMYQRVRNKNAGIL
ncbi:MAG: SWIM zinc finger family protein, partial [Microcystis sp.]|uniref:SWIM zinc finger family protein n=1 Tax=Microcystis sp. TaxID=1127 RepID=UPI00391F4300